MRHSQILSSFTILLIASFFTGFERAHSQNGAGFFRTEEPITVAYVLRASTAVSCIDALVLASVVETALPSVVGGGVKSWRVPATTRSQTRSIVCTGFQPNDINAFASAETSFNPVRALIYPQRIDFSYLFRSSTFSEASVIPRDGQYYLEIPGPIGETEILPGVMNDTERVFPDNALLTIPFTVSSSTYAVIGAGITANYTVSGAPPPVCISVPEGPQNPVLMVSVYREEPNRELVNIGRVTITLPSWASCSPYTQYGHSILSVPLLAGYRYYLTLHHYAKVGWININRGRYVSLAGAGGMGVSLVFILNRTTVPVVPVEAFYCDVNSDGSVDDADLLAILVFFGHECRSQPCAEDINGDGLVDDADLLAILSNFGLTY